LVMRASLLNGMSRSKEMKCLLWELQWGHYKLAEQRWNPRPCHHNNINTSRGYSLTEPSILTLWLCLFSYRCILSSAYAGWKEIQELLLLGDANCVLLHFWLIVSHPVTYVLLDHRLEKLVIIKAWLFFTTGNSQLPTSSWVILDIQLISDNL
jgi:hypothetical protein